jgi:hypothetical protein
MFYYSDEVSLSHVLSHVLLRVEALVRQPTHNVVVVLTYQ